MNAEQRYADPLRSTTSVRASPMAIADMLIDRPSPFGPVGRRRTGGATAIGNNRLNPVMARD